MRNPFFLQIKCQSQPDIYIYIYIVSLSHCGAHCNDSVSPVSLSYCVVSMRGVNWLLHVDITRENLPDIKLKVLCIRCDVEGSLMIFAIESSRLIMFLR